MIASLSSRALRGIYILLINLFTGKQLLFLLQSQKGFDVFFVRLVHKTRFSQISFLLFGLFGQDVTFKSMLPFDFSCSGKGEPLFGTGISLNFWHFALFEFVYIHLSRPLSEFEKVCKINDLI